MRLKVQNLGMEQLAPLTPMESYKDYLFNRTDRYKRITGEMPPMPSCDVVKEWGAFEKMKMWSEIYPDGRPYPAVLSQQFPVAAVIFAER